MAIAPTPVLTRLALASLAAFSLFLAAPQAHAQDKVLTRRNPQAHPRHHAVFL